MKIITKDDFGTHIDWRYFVDALDAGHALPKAEIEDVFLGPVQNTLLSRAARIEGIGFGVKSVTIMAGNAARGLPSVQGGMLVFEEETGTPRALIDSNLITDIKTAADSALGARYLARHDSRHLVMVGAGSVAQNIISAFLHVFPSLDQITIWNRTLEKAESLAAKAASSGIQVVATSDLAGAIADADIVSCATMSLEPVLNGKWLCPGTHVDLIGAFRTDMREADDDVLRRGNIYVDSRDTTIDHIGELKIPLAAGTISPTDILADLYELKRTGKPERATDAITVFKNGGGAHLDLMIADAILKIDEKSQ